ncbi:hypothetical protein C8R47DRAFT_1260864 [Mycena vitilis]|nr:hypothetical protein C8R47DRAFT_1260864 [Mycena vitilis]
MRRVGPKRRREREQGGSTALEAGERGGQERRWRRDKQGVKRRGGAGMTSAGRFWGPEGTHGGGTTRCGGGERRDGAREFGITSPIGLTRPRRRDTAAQDATDSQRPGCPVRPARTGPAPTDPKRSNASLGRALRPNAHAVEVGAWRGTTTTNAAANCSSRSDPPRAKVYIAPVKPTAAHPDPLDAVPGLAHRLPPALLVVLRSLGKKAPVTKVRALEELLGRIHSEEEEWAVREMLPVWTHHVPGLLVHPTRRVRLLTAQVHAVLLPLLTDTPAIVSSVWGLAAHDPERAVASLNPAPAPVPDAKPTQRPTGVAVASQQPRAKADEQDESAFDRRARLRIAGIGALRWLLESTPTLPLPPFLASPALWSALQHDVYVDTSNMGIVSLPEDDYTVYLKTELADPHHASFSSRTRKDDDDADTETDTLPLGRAQPALRRAAWGLLGALLRDLDRRSSGAAVIEGAAVVEGGAEERVEGSERRELPPALVLTLAHTALPAAWGPKMVESVAGAGAGAERACGGDGASAARSGGELRAGAAGKAVRRVAGERRRGAWASGQQRARWRRAPTHAVEIAPPRRAGRVSGSTQHATSHRAHCCPGIHYRLGKGRQDTILNLVMRQGGFPRCWRATLRTRWRVFGRSKPCLCDALGRVSKAKGAGGHVRVIALDMRASWGGGSQTRMELLRQDPDRQYICFRLFSQNAIDPSSALSTPL